MRRTELLQGLREMRFEALLERWYRRELSQGEAAEALGMSERSFRRWHTHWLEEGAAGLRDRRIGRPSPHRMTETAKAEVCRLYREHYADHTPQHFHDQLVKRHDYRLGYTVTKLTLYAAGLAKPAVRRGVHRRKRPRRPVPGMMLFQDGSPFAWLPGSARQLDLVVTMDDATSKLYSAILVEEEGTVSSFLGLAETIAAEGLFCALYTDRGSHYFVTPEAGGRVDRTRLTHPRPAPPSPPPARARGRAVLCSHEERVVANDNTVRYRARTLQIPESPLRRHFVKAAVRVHEYPDGTLAIFHGPPCLARYPADGSTLAHPNPRDARRSPRAACGSVDGATPRPHPHRPNNHNKSGQLTSYQNRST